MIALERPRIAPLSPRIDGATSPSFWGCRALPGAYLSSAMNVVTRRRVQSRSIGRPDDLFGPSSRLPEGFRYSADLLTPEREESLARELAALPFKPFDFHGYQANRQVVGFGFRYDYGARQVVEAPPLPSFLEPLRRTIAEAFDRPAQAFEQVLINEYPPRRGHRVAPGQGPVRRGGRSVAARPLHLPLPPEKWGRLGSRFADGRAALGLSPIRTVADGMGAQHSCARPAPLFDHLPDARSGAEVRGPAVPGSATTTAALSSGGAMR